MTPTQMTTTKMTASVNVPDPNDRDRNVPGPNDRDQNDLDPISRVMGSKQPQPRFECRGCSCYRLEFSDIFGQHQSFLIFFGQHQSFLIFSTENCDSTEKDWTGLLWGVMGRPQTATAIWLQIAVAVWSRCRVWGPL